MNSASTTPSSNRTVSSSGTNTAADPNDLTPNIHSAGFTTTPSYHQSLSTESAAVLSGSGTPPTPGGFKQSANLGADDKKSRRTSYQVLLPKLPSSDSLSNYSPGPASPAKTVPIPIFKPPKVSITAPAPSSPPSSSNNNDQWHHKTIFRSISLKGLTNWTDSCTKVDGPDKLTDASKLNRKESYKAQRKNYRREKKRVASELLNSLQDPAIIVLADWLKVRGTLKSWTKLWCVLKPGLLLLYKSPKTKSSHWVGTILLTSCQIIERPSKKDGFCFKLFHPLDQSIWAPRGPDKETIGAVVQPLPTAYLIFRAPSQAAGKCWMDALELSLRCSALLLRSASSSGNHNETHAGAGTSAETMTNETQWSEADYEKHFYDHEYENKNHLAKPLFLAKYIPPTPPENRSNHPTIDPRHTNFQRSPCPSPTPMFQQLYCAVAHWERVMADSPDLCVMDKERIIKDLENLPKHKFFISRDEGEDTDDEGSNNESSALDNILHLNSIRQGHHVDIMQKCIGITSSSSGEPKTNSNNLDIDSQTDGANAVMSGLESESESDVADVGEPPEDEFPETQYVHCAEEEFGAAGEQVEELAEEHKSFIWFLVKQVRPGMDLSKVVLPTFILEPRSFLDKLSDSYYHADYLSKAVLEDDPFDRMKLVVQWYVSGFYKKPKGLKKPYNPILGETFRCYWQHENGSRTFYIAEQVSHHPPISAFYVTNRQDGFSISCSMLAKSKFYGNSTSAILDGTATLILLPRGESYTLSIPYAHCKGILMGTLSMELGGKVMIECENTGYKADIEFKLKPFLGGSEYTNLMTARLKLGKETLATISGHWDSEIKIKDLRSGEESVLFSPTPDVRARRLKRFSVPIESQGSNESERLWQHVSAAIHRDDQVAATEEKTALEESQRALAKERKATCSEWTPLLFQQDLITGQWHYKWADIRAWDLRNDLRQYESNYRIQTKTRHQAPMVRTASLISSEPIILQAESRSSLAALKKSKRLLGRKISSPDLVDETDSSHSSGVVGVGHGIGSNKKIMESLQSINKKLDEQTKKLAIIQLNLDKLSFAPPSKRTTDFRPSSSFLSQLTHSYQTICYIAIGLFLHALLTWYLTKK